MTETRLPGSLGPRLDCKEFVSVAKRAFRNWRTNNDTLRAAALAFFMILPLPSLLVIVADVLGNQALTEQARVIAGPTIAALVGGLLSAASDPLRSGFVFALSVAFVVAGVIGAFAVLQDSLNVVWVATLPHPRSLGERVRQRLVPFSMVLGMAASVVISAGLVLLLLNSVSGGVRRIFGILASPIDLGVTLVVSFGLAAFLFAIIYHEVPDTDVTWRDVTVAALMSGLVFMVMNNLYGFYLQTFPVTTIGGAAGSLIVLLLWIFVINESMLYGAEFSKAYAETVGSRAKPLEKLAKPLPLTRRH